MGLMALVLSAGSASATPIVVDGNWSDWFTLSLQGAESLNHINWYDNRVTLSDVNIRTQVDPENDANGGQNYDVEQIFYYYDDADHNNLTGGTFHVALITGFDPAGVGALEAGDLFMDFGNTGSYSLAVAVGTDDPGRFEDAWTNSGAPNWTLTSALPPFTPVADPYRVDETQAGATPFAGAQVAWSQHGKHWFMELTIDVDGGVEDLLTNEQNGGGVGLHWTMECGNDYINVNDDTPFAPVPEPATMVLFGMGVLGVALRARRPLC